MCFVDFTIDNDIPIGVKLESDPYLSYSYIELAFRNKNLAISLFA